MEGVMSWRRVKSLLLISGISFEKEGSVDLES
jgi:hypothetical protein